MLLKHQVLICWECIFRPGLLVYNKVFIGANRRELPDDIISEPMEDQQNGDITKNSE